MALLALVGTAVAARAEALPDPLRLIPDKADFFFKIEQPRKLVETIYYHELFKQFRTIDAIREAYDSTNARRLYQLIAYFEKKLGCKWPELLDRLAGGGAVISAKFGSPAPVLFVLQARDEKLLRHFFKLGLEVIEHELARQEVKAQPIKVVHRNIETVHLGPQFHAAVAGSALFVSNHAKALQAALDLHLDGGQANLARLDGVVEARKGLPANPVAWSWLNFEPVHHIPQARNLFDEKQNDPILTVSVGFLLDILRRSPHLSAGLYLDDKGLRARVLFPRGREGMADKFAVFAPAADQVGSLPLLEPRNVLFSTSYYLDVYQFWDKRKKLFNDKQVQTFEQFDRNSGPVLSGTRFSQLTKQAGRYQRFVVAQQTAPGYKTRPSQLFPAGAFVLELREPEEFTKALETILRGAALLGGGQLDLKLVEEKRGGWNIVGYRFPEGPTKNRALRNDTGNIRFNFSPCFVRVGNQFVMSSTIELARELVDILEKEAKEGKGKGSPDVSRTRLYASGGVAALHVFKEQLLTQTILGRAVSPSDAVKEVEVFIKLFARLGVLQIKEQLARDHFSYDVEWILGR
jgi:hypothetical protein